MERRNNSLKILSELIYIDSLDSYEKADALVIWCNEHLVNDEMTNLDLQIDDLKNLEELFYKNINFLKKHQEETRLELLKMKKMKSFLKN